MDGKICRKDDFPVGLMDVISMPEADKYYRVMPSTKGLVWQPNKKVESNFKLLRVEDKSTVKNGVQIALHDGSNMLVKVADVKKPIEVTYDTLPHSQSHLSRQTSCVHAENQRRKLSCDYRRKKHRQKRQNR